MKPNALHEYHPLKYILFVFVLSVPFWLFGGSKLPVAVNLPVSALMLVVPVTAAAILTYMQKGFKGVKELFKKTFDYKNIKNKMWYIPTLLLNPIIYFLSYVVMRLMGLPLSVRMSNPSAPVFS
jgi:hypothetical protein